jgi:hypothetical protein
MCDTKFIAAGITPEEELRQLVLHDLGVNVPVRELALFVKHRWPKLKELAHAIHEAG